MGEAGRKEVMTDHATDRHQRIMLRLSQRMRDIAEIRSRREWDKVFSETCDVQVANKAGRTMYGNTLLDLVAEFRRIA